MPFCIKLGLDPALPLMAWEDRCVIYPLDHIHSAKGRRLRATETRLQALVQKAVSEACTSFVPQGTLEDHVRVREVVVERLCRDYGFVVVDAAKHVILWEELRRKRSKTPVDEA